MSGKVITSEESSGLPGVNVLVKGTTSGTVTDVDGNYRIDVPQEAVLVFSSIGFIPEEAAVNGRSVINISLTADITTLSEVVVVGYGTQKRADLTGAISSVSSEEIKNLPVRSVAEAIQGKVAGVMVTQGGGNPRNGGNIIIRGPVNVNGRGPLYVVDGIPFIGTGSAFNIQDVESIDVLKDASAAA
ncbi:MAG: carboxypeptidase-like regulatory domain-containing protein, partial [Bacteroidota bacterium]|nr:carboxypeptidase-like regulatory domain-containing protein [Bacteroidota bacterium]